MQNIKYRIDNKFTQRLHDKFWDVGSLDNKVFNNVKMKLRIYIKNQISYNSLYDSFININNNLENAKY
jgi:hypothetical protein